MMHIEGKTMSGMDDTLYGTRDKRGNWIPSGVLRPSALYAWPFEPKRFLRWLFGYPGFLWPSNALYLLLSIVAWIYLTPSLETMRDFSAGWVSLVLLRNATLALLVYGAWHYLFYIRRRQQDRFKFDSRWPDSSNRAFLFGGQTRENVFWTMCSAVPVWTAYEVFMWWMFANGYVPWIDFTQHPVWFIALMLLAPFWKGLHFYLVHRLLHMGALYGLFHKLHHKNVNPGPWSGLSMHPVEHILYFSGVLIHLVVPSHPLHAMFQLVMVALTPAEGHVGFGRMVTRKDRHMNTGDYFHYLHHRYFEVNYGTQSLPLDWVFGTALDGTPQAHEAMVRRMREKHYARLASK